MLFDFFTGLSAIVAGAIAAVAGFGLGSILTPVLSVKLGTQIAVAAVSIPHFVATFVRFWMLRRDVDRHVLITFGIMSAAGGLGGALLHSVVSSRVLSIVFAGLLMFAGVSAMTGYAQRMRFGSKAAWIAGALSGLLGGLVGNQGGIRSAALLGFQLERRAFVATATAIALFVDGARMPVYLATAGNEMISNSSLIVLSTIGALVGTFLGTAVLQRIPHDTFNRLVGILIFGLGVFMAVRAVLVTAELGASRRSALNAEHSGLPSVESAFRPDAARNRSPPRRQRGGGPIELIVGRRQHHEIHTVAPYQIRQFPEITFDCRPVAFQQQTRRYTNAHASSSCVQVHYGVGVGQHARLRRRVPCQPLPRRPCAFECSLLACD